MSKTFYIVGLPRSRTKWLGVFMHGGNVFCGHDLFSHTTIDTSAFDDIDHYKYKGSVDTNPINAIKYLEDMDAPLVVIDRPLDEVKESLYVAFGGDVPFSELGTKLEEYHDALDEAKGIADLVVPFDQIDEYLEMIWETCCPDESFDYFKAATLEHISITVKELAPSEFLMNT